ncbi:ankyrin repeat domain-containing protein SOWAHA [Carassius carassius]|uniref:ankyrin repeat domain-containing protein SOWAHA n=1 Tax=Carassius carassius TaxID=217509 RepID=UPI002868EA80|nr:ankyrin repeat domain-containing protein SOWAHA [Carassius carassius]
MALTQDLILAFLLERGGKVKNSELVSNFKGLLNSADPAEKKLNRDLFKRLVNSVAVVKQVDDVKYVAVKKKYQGENISSTESPCSRKPSQTQNVDVINNNHCHCSPQTVCNSIKSAESVHPGRPSDCNATESLTARVLSMTSDAKSGKSGAVFALVAIKSPAYDLQHEENGIRSLKTVAGDAEPLPATIERTRKVKASFTQVKWCHKLSKPAKVSDGVPLGLMEHEWLVKAATGSWHQIYSLLLQEPRLADKPSFMSGFTILHWAAKSGNCEMVCKVIDVSRQRGAAVDVNAKSYDGYTALHIAAIHSRERVLSLLVCEYGANTNIRDNSGKKPYRYLSPDVSTDIRKMLGDPHSLLKDAQNPSDLPKGFNTLSKLFHPHIAGHKKKYRRRPSFHFIRDDHEDPRKNAALHRKLLQ